MEISLNISKIIVLQGYGTDKVQLCTDLPCAILSNRADDPVHLSFDTTKGCGVTYANRQFPGIPIEVINMKG